MTYNPISDYHLCYSINGQLYCKTIPSGGQLKRVEDPFGRHVDFDFAGNGDLIRITDMGGYWTALTYDADSYIASMQDDRSTTGFYIEPSDNIGSTEIYPAPGNNMRSRYRITVTHPDGHKSEYYYNDSNGTGWYVSPRDYVDYVRRRQGP